MKKALVVLFVLLSFTVGVHADVIDAPHTQSQGVYCGDCHTYSFWWQFSPLDQDPDRDVNNIEPLCNSCHDGTGTAPFAINHTSSLLVAGMHRTELGDWSRTCLDCHDPHFQEQLRGWAGDLSVPDTDLYLIQGTMVIDTLVDNGDGASSFSYTLTSGKTKPTWADPVSWANKSGPGRGLILVVSLNDSEATFEVDAASEDSPGSETGSITVTGVIAPTFNGAHFGLIYGQLINNQIAVDPDLDTNFSLADVKFFDGKGGFVDSNGTDGDGVTGICQVCHSANINHFQFDGLTDGLPDPHSDVLGGAESLTLRCTICHAHDVAFGHGSDGGSSCTGCHNSQKHVEHLNLEINCSRCHGSNVSDGNGNILLDITTTTICSECHHDGTDLNPADGNGDPNITDYKDGWGEPAYIFSCSGCHNVPPDYLNGFPKTNSHVPHINAGYTCDKCHFSTTEDGVGLTVTGSHANAIYDATPGTNVFFTYDQQTSSCNNISCHNNKNATWGSSLGCEECHLDSSDLDDFIFNNLNHAIISNSEWLDTGHGRTANQYSSGNLGAGLSCEYCHDDSVSHGQTTNVFLLANIGTDLNGVCWVCHKTGSLGYDPDGGGTDFINRTASKKIDSYHFGVRHGTGVNNGGRFCWDCHDPHGDSNMFMVHANVSIVSDPVNGVPLSTAAVSFINNSGGTDYARPSPSATYDGICNVCHTNVAYYTSTAGDASHDVGQVCVTCHKHSGPSDGDAFSEGSCEECHIVAVDNGDSIPIGGRRAVVSEFPTGNTHAHYGNSLDSGDCAICHDQTSHMDGNVDLIDADNATITYSFVKRADLDSDPNNPAPDTSDFCSSCHDADGALRLATPSDPFGNGNLPPDAKSKFMGSVEYTEWTGSSCFGYSGSARPVNSHHDISDADHEFSGAKLECLSCHGAHNSALSQKLADPQNTLVSWTGTNNEFCLSCHEGGAGPANPGFPVDVEPPTFFTNYIAPPTNQVNTPGTPCDWDGDTIIDDGYVWDCADECELESELMGAIGDGYCDDGSWGYILRCDAFQNDAEDCQCIGDDCSQIGGIDTCKAYIDPPWNVVIPWHLSAHGANSKRSWPEEYLQSPPAPSFELNCLDCHDHHGSAWKDGNGQPVGNPYLIRDSVDGTGYIDDGCRTGQIGCSQSSTTTGSSGNVTVEVFGYLPDFAKLCEKCHAQWYDASDAHESCGGCLSCHSHGNLYGEMDHAVGTPDHQFCP